MNKVLRKSRYTFLLDAGDRLLVYNSAKNNFWKVNSNVFEFIKEFNGALESLNDEENEIASLLHKLSIITTEEEDLNIAESFRLKFLTSSFSKENLDLTIAPTLSCNLRCPYCFEANKPTAIMDQKTADQTISFIKKHEFARNVRITWFGGEPLICGKQIEHILNGLLKLDNPKLSHQEIVTNGALLKGDNLKLFETFDFKAIQITFDGTKPNHDKKRVTSNNTGTFDVILCNLDNFISRFPSVSVKIRVNIDKTNGDDFPELYRFLTNRYKEKNNLFIYPGILKACETTSKNAPFLCNAELSALYNKYMKHGLLVSYPQFGYLGCGANRISCYVIGPKGELYKCWQDVGMENKVIGNIFDDDFSDYSLLNQYMLHGSRMNEQTCLECPMMPICDSNCANDRLDNFYNHGNRELCSVYKENDYQGLKEKLISFYKLLEQKQSSEPLQC